MTIGKTVWQSAIEDIDDVIANGKYAERHNKRPAEVGR